MKLKKIWDAITLPFISVAVMIDESKRINDDGTWSEYNRKRNEKKRKHDAP